MEYIIGVLMSWGPLALAAVLLGIAAWFFTGSKKRGFTYFGVALAVSLMYAAVQPSNTYKVRVEKLPNPVVSKEKKEIKEMGPIVDIESIKKRHEELTDWKGRVQ